MTGLFDSIIDSIVGIDNFSSSTIGSALGAAYTGYANSEKANAAKRASANLNEGFISTPTMTAEASRAKAKDSVDPDALEREWYSRLNKFSNMQQTPVKPR